jgi:hypothetical protein
LVQMTTSGGSLRHFFKYIRLPRLALSVSRLGRPAKA